MQENNASGTEKVLAAQKKKHKDNEHLRKRKRETLQNDSNKEKVQTL